MQVLIISILCFVSVTGFMKYNHRILKSHNVALRVIATPLSEIPKSIRQIPYSGPGCVLLSQPEEKDDYLTDSAILIFSSSKQHGTQGVVLDKPSAFTMHQVGTGLEHFKDNTVFTGGNGGQDSVIMIHAYPLDGICRPIGKGLYLGGYGGAKELVKKLEAAPMDFKFFFNNVVWKYGELEKQIEKGRWIVCEAPPSKVLQQDPFEERPSFIWHQFRDALQLS